MLTNIDTKMKIAHAREMVVALTTDGRFTPSTYEKMRHYWDMRTPTWPTLKKYADKIGLVAETVTATWHSDGSVLAEMAAADLGGTEYTYVVYRFQ